MSKISIIIPTYNRAHLIGQTLDSIIAQTYQDWECLVIDDGSSDYTTELMTFYCEKDKRINYYSRPLHKNKGANACRNYGFELSTGNYINWFDSDDLMKPENLQIKIESFNEHLDFVIGNSVNFDEKNSTYRPYVFNYSEKITPENFIGGRIGWITNDVLIRRKAVKIKFNEKLNSGQEYNFFSRLLFITNRGSFLNKDLVFRRIHSESIQEKLKTSGENIKFEELFHNELELYKDIKDKASDKIKRRSIRRMIRFSHHSSKKFHLKKDQWSLLFELLKNNYPKQALLWTSWMFSNFLFGKGYKILKVISNNLKS